MERRGVFIVRGGEVDMTVKCGHEARQKSLTWWSKVALNHSSKASIAVDAPSRSVALICGVHSKEAGSESGGEWGNTRPS